MDVKKLFTILAVSLVIAGCGGGGSSDGGSGNAQSSTVNANAMNGIYFGSGVEEGFGNFQILTLIENGKMYAISDTGVGYSGTLSLNEESRYNSSLTLYDTDNFRFDSASVSGVYTTDKTLIGDYSRSSGPTGEIFIEYLPEAYEKPASLELISDTWQVLNAFAVTSVTIDQNGTIFGTDSDGCVFSGDMAVPNANRNMYRVTLKIESCGSVNGDYQGLGYIVPDSYDNNMIVFASNASIGFVFDLAR